MMEEPVLLPKEYSVACDSLVQEDVQGRQGSFVFQQFGGSGVRYAYEQRFNRTRTLS